MSSKNQLFDGERHIPLVMQDGSIEVANWVGPRTQVIKRLRRGDKGKTATDNVAMRHDIDYTNAKNLDDIRTADQRMINKLNQIQSNKSDNLVNILAGKKAIQSKIFLEDKGILSKNAFADFNDNLLDDEKLLVNQKIQELEMIGYGFKKNIKALYSSEIEEYLKFIPFFKGVFAKDEVKKIKVKNNENFAFVLNLENHNQTGSHWVCIFNDNKLPYMEYFDSFGLEPPTEIELLAKKIRKQIFYNPYQHQKPDSIRCGYYCIHYIIKRFSGMLPDAVLSKFTNTPSDKNEKLSVQF